MSVRRIMGTEVEYGISVPGQPGANPMMTSSQIVNAYASHPELARGSRARWDYEEETPLRDARGFTYNGALHDPAENLADDDTGLANVILTNGARFYVDHAHPEYSTPEVTNPWDALLYDKAGEETLAAAAERAASTPGVSPITLYKNNTDNKGASYGCHENFLMDRSVPFSDIVAHLTPFLVTRQVFAGAGRVGIGQDASEPGFQITQRSDFFEVEVGLETTLKRPIINTRDEPHADADRYRRLHVIIGDANMSETAIFLKLGTTSLILAMIEAGVLDGSLAVAEPVAELRAVSHDPSLKHKIELRNGSQVTAVELQQRFHSEAVAFCGDSPDEQTAEVLRLWGEVLAKLENDPFECADILDWPAKLKLLNRYRSRENLDWNAAKLQAIDLQYHDVRRDKGLYHRLVARGAMKRLASDADIQHAMAEPPADTRAFFRGRCLEKFPAQVVAASWDSVIFDVGRDSLVRIPMSEPTRGTAEHVQELFERCESAEELLDIITGKE